MTPLLQELSCHCSNNELALFNSERIPWLPNVLNDLKPDFHVKHICFNSLNATAHHPSTSSMNIFLFGGIINKEYVKQVAFIWEGKTVNLGNTEYGTMLNYLMCLRQAGNSNPRGVLYNSSEWVYFQFDNGYLTKKINGDWTDRGSKNFLKECVQTAPRDILTTALIHFESSFGVRAKLWLGCGAEGHVFLVSSSDGNEYAMKISICGSLEREFELLKKTKEKVPNMIVDTVRTPMKVDINGKLCGAFLMEVGNAIDRRTRIIPSLVILHLSGITHGDPRYNNILRFNNDQLKWIDLRSVQAFTTIHDIKKDLSILFKSILYKKNIDLPLIEHDALLTEYANNPSEEKANALYGIIYQLTA
jgi:hypothetical protein